MSDDDPLRYQPIETLRIRDAPMTHAVDSFNINPNTFRDPEIRELYIKARNDARKRRCQNEKEQSE